MRHIGMILLLGLASPALAQADPNAKPAPPPAVPNDRIVAGLNEPAFAMLQRLRRDNPGPFSEVDAVMLRQVLLADERIDPVERELLDEMVKPRFESISVTGTGPAKLVLFPASGNPRKVFIDMLLPKLDLVAAWTRGASGWTEIINDHAQNPVRAQRIMNFVSGKLGIEWQASNTSNGYKPLRDAIGRLTGFNASLKEPQASAGKSILYRAMLQADRKDADKIPDFLYNHLRPPAFVE